MMLKGSSNFVNFADLITGQEDLEAKQTPTRIQPQLWV
jgi:hypothetical protein